MTDSRSKSSNSLLIEKERRRNSLPDCTYCPNAKFGIYSGSKMTVEQMKAYKKVAKEHAEYIEARLQQALADVATKHGISKDELWKIAEEGGQKKWPRPPDD